MISTWTLEVFNAEISAAIEERLSRTNYGDASCRAGHHHGRPGRGRHRREHRPDGTSVVPRPRRDLQLEDKPRHA